MKFDVSDMNLVEIDNYTKPESSQKIKALSIKNEFFESEDASILLQNYQNF